MSIQEQLSSWGSRDGPLAATVRCEADLHRIEVAGGLDIVTTPEFLEKVLACVSSEPGKLILDLRKVGFCGSSGISALLDIETIATRTGTELGLVVSGAVRRAITVLGFAERFQMSDTLDDAVAMLR